MTKKIFSLGGYAVTFASKEAAIQLLTSVDVREKGVNDYPLTFAEELALRLGKKGETIPDKMKLSVRIKKRRVLVPLRYIPQYQYEEDGRIIPAHFER